MIAGRTVCFFLTLNSLRGLWWSLPTRGYGSTGVKAHFSRLWRQFSEAGRKRFIDKISSTPYIYPAAARTAYFPHVYLPPTRPTDASLSLNRSFKRLPASQSLIPAKHSLLDPGGLEQTTDEPPCTCTTCTWHVDGLPCRLAVGCKTLFRGKPWSMSRRSVFRFQWKIQSINFQ